MAVGYYDISNWEEKQYFQTGGTRNKCVVENPKTGELYYFKTSLKRENDEYKHEFWSEIVASEIGRYLRFDILRYNIAFNKGEMGCLSKSMVDTNIYKLSEIKNYLCGYDNNYNPEDKNFYSKYTFDFIESALKDYHLESRMKHIVLTIIFDSLIGNGDRHQENWGFIIPNTFLNEKIKNESIDSKILRIFWNFIGKKSKNDFIEEFEGKFSPIYDSGSCLGRELLDNKVDKMLADKQMLESYINRDKCELRWNDGRKISHFELIKKIRNESKYGNVVIETLKNLEQRFDYKKIEERIYGVDNRLPISMKRYKLPNNRKNLMVKLVSLRFEKLRSVIK